MPDDRLQRARVALPVGYQFGDAKWTPAQIEALKRRDASLDRLDTGAAWLPKWRRMCESAAEQLARSFNTRNFPTNG